MIYPKDIPGVIPNHLFLLKQALTPVSVCIYSWGWADGFRRQLIRQTCCGQGFPCVQTLNHFLPPYFVYSKTGQIIHYKLQRAELNCTALYCDSLHSFLLPPLGQISKTDVLHLLLQLCVCRMKETEQRKNYQQQLRSTTQRQLNFFLTSYIKIKKIDMVALFQSCAAFGQNMIPMHHLPTILQRH